MSPLMYFRRPFPSTEGFSAYRMPGLSVHLPLILAFVFVGFFLCWPYPVLRPLLIVWVLAGVYLGRDIAILCHYTPLLTLICWAACLTVLFKAASIARFGVSHTVTPAVLSLALGTVLFIIAFLASREDDSGGRLPDSKSKQ